jgi:hypothetical protein
MRIDSKTAHSCDMSVEICSATLPSITNVIKLKPAEPMRGSLFATENDFILNAWSPIEKVFQSETPIHSFTVPSISEWIDRNPVNWIQMCYLWSERRTQLPLAHNLEIREDAMAEVVTSIRKYKSSWCCLRRGERICVSSNFLVEIVSWNPLISYPGRRSMRIAVYKGNICCCLFLRALDK